MPRASLDVSKYFSTDSDGKKWVCRFCRWPLSVYNVTRMNAHSMKCKKTPDVASPTSSTHISPLSVCSPSSSKTSSCSLTFPPMKQSRLTFFVDSFKFDDQEKANVLFARAIYSSGIPLSLCDANENWCSLFNHL